jgi:hypothetical protein
MLTCLKQYKSIFRKTQGSGFNTAIVKKGNDAIYKYSNGQGGKQVKMIGQGIFEKSVF